MPSSSLINIISGTINLILQIHTPLAQGLPFLLRPLQLGFPLCQEVVLFI
ncbi:hypothetical protein EST38_g5565 [Candolleomyces aberdarensis]|uniref:Uncharacterized protein n=1 Tax=Candolleomyces aberdarensis TaxID=2316362 RepID=A0A4Q2DK79_9AGAR|nr:hypothetical protein EST38_g5565 [Candolleomyces aberdarensis]